jgi:hypothetical protein
MLENLDEIIKSTNGTRKARTLDARDAERFTELFNQHKDNQEVHTIRVYSGQGFVANAYKYRADICALQATRQANGEWDIRGIVVDAKRSHGNGALATVNGRAA